MVHVGDDYLADYIISSEIGITAFHLKKGKTSKKNTIHSLVELGKKL